MQLCGSLNILWHCLELPDFKLDFEKVEEPEIKLPTSVGSSKKQESARKTFASLTTPKPLCGSQPTVENSERDGNTRPPYLPPEESVCRSRRLLLGRKAMTNLDSILESRDITLLTKVCLVKAMVFPVVMYSCESWTIKKAECRKINAFELWCWRRLLRVPWTARWSSQPILKETSPEYSLEGLMLKLKCNTLITWCEEQTP